MTQPLLGLCVRAEAPRNLGKHLLHPALPRLNALQSPLPPQILRGWPSFPRAFLLALVLHLTRRLLRPSERSPARGTLLRPFSRGAFHSPLAQTSPLRQLVSSPAL
ncbi:hypothetical protein ACG7TL_005851 [Trametes sanguinea]